MMATPSSPPLGLVEDEVSAFKSAFDTFEQDDSGRVSIHCIPELLERAGFGASEELIRKVEENAENENISFDDLLAVIQAQKLEGTSQNGEFHTGPDPKVMEFISILEEYRLKCEEDGNYLEAQRADTQLTALRRQEFKRQSKAIKARQIAERQDIQIAHNMQFNDFNKAWDQYLEEYDRMAKAYVKQLTDKHAHDLLELQQKLQQEVVERPPKFSKELIEWRRRQHRLAQQKAYAEAQKIKKIADEIEQNERSKLGDDYRLVAQRKEDKLRQHQRAELGALLKRIDGRRKEHLKQRQLDSKRLLQRNRNVQSVLESKQTLESTKTLQDIRTSLLPRERTVPKGVHNVIPPEARVVRSKKRLNQAGTDSPVLSGSP